MAVSSPRAKPEAEDKGGLRCQKIPGNRAVTIIYPI